MARHGLQVAGCSSVRRMDLKEAPGADKIFETTAGMGSNGGKDRRVGGACRAVQVGPSSEQWDGCAGGPKGGTRGASRGRLLTTPNKRVGPEGGKRKKKASRSLGYDEEWDWGWPGEEKGGSGRTTQTRSGRQESSPAPAGRARHWPRRPPRGVQAEPEGARRRGRGWDSRPPPRTSRSSRGCFGRSRRGQLGTARPRTSPAARRPPRPPRPRHPQAPRVPRPRLPEPRLPTAGTWRRHCGSDAR